jgi:hypothetical protein
MLATLQGLDPITLVTAGSLALVALASVLTGSTGRYA